MPGPLRRLAILAVALTLALGVAQAADPFTGRGAPSETGASAGPAFAGGLMLRLANAQRDLNDAISAAFREVRDRNSATAILLILGLAFLYGVLHALGPGHGKAVVASYFVANRARWSQGIAMGSLISLIQGAAAIVMVGLLAVLLQWRQFDVLDRATLVEFVSYGLIAALGLVMFWRAVTGRGHDHGLGAADAHDGHAHDRHDHRHTHDPAGHVHARVHEHGADAVLAHSAPAGVMALGASSVGQVSAPAPRPPRRSSSTRGSSSPRV